jgi:O-antigen/teichoic acid export membrane protein
MGSASTDMQGAAAPCKTNLLKWSSSARAGAAIRGSAWFITGYVLTQLLRTGSTLILARYFLGPESFGVVGLVAVFLGGVSMFSEMGIVTNIVQHPRGDDSEFLNTAFSIQAARGFAIWIVSLLAAYPLATFYGQPEVFPLLAVAGLSETIRGLTSTSTWTLNRHLSLSKLTFLSVTSEAVGSGISIVWAVISPSAWALVARTVANAFAYTVGSHFIGKRAVRFGWNQAAAKDIAQFGGWISLATAMHFLGGQGERLILAKFITAQELGCFSLAVMISAVPSRGISQLVNQIYLPMISQTVRTSPTATVRDFLRARRVFFAVGLLAGIGFLGCGKPLVTLLLNSKYQMAGWMLQFLGLRVALETFASPVSNLILASGESKYSAAGNATRVVLMVAGLSIAFARFGVREAIMALIFAQAVSYLPLISGLRRVLPEVAQTELRWYGVLLLLLASASLVPWLGT